MEMGKGFELANGLPFVATDKAIHEVQTGLKPVSNISPGNSLFPDGMDLPQTRAYTNSKTGIIRDHCTKLLNAVERNPISINIKLFSRLQTVKKGKTLTPVLHGCIILNLISVSNNIYPVHSVCNNSQINTTISIISFIKFQFAIL